jgi:hypothetical protein
VYAPADGTIVGPARVTVVEADVIVPRDDVEDKIEGDTLEIRLEAVELRADDGKLEDVAEEEKLEVRLEGVKLGADDKTIEDVEVIIVELLVELEVNRL